MNDRYLKVTLTIIALELLWLGVKDIGIPVSAQARATQAAAAQPAAAPAGTPQPVIIRGIELKDPRAVMPVAAAAPFPITSARALLVDVDRPLPIVGAAPLKVEADKPLLIEADRPLPVQSVPYTPGKTPGE
jgi:hypothetical protein